MSQNVPKPSIEPTIEHTQEKHVLLAPEGVPQPDGFGTPEVAPAVAIAERAGQEIARKFHTLAPRHKRNLVAAFRRQLLPPGKPGRKRSKEISAAYADWQAGMRGLPLYREHIPGFDRMGYWKRKAKERSLMDAIRTRKRREERRRTREAEAAAGRTST